MISSNPDCKSTTLIWDNEASFFLTPISRDLIDYVREDNPVKVITKVNRVVGISTIIFACL